ncbi:MAG: cell division protein FtsX [Porphyromonadaceae bacterium CG2_30_38_12]|nr:MAG: cell division protein FtsX [Porphyromonadaceae bacterium CG2_30_38_12]
MKKFRNIEFGSTLSMSLVLFLIGLVTMLLFVAKDMSVFVKENINLSVIMQDDQDESQANRIEKYLLDANYAHSVIYISKQDALKEHIAALGEDPQEFLGFNPLKASLEVKLKAEYANTDSVNLIEQKLKTFDGIDRIAYQKDLISLVNDNVRKISLILLGLAFVLLLVAVALINNTVRLSVYSNRFLINTMQMVGATNWFIRKPYVRRAIIIGVVAAILSLILLLFTLYYVLYEFELTGFSINPVSAFLISFIVIFSGIVLMAVSTYLSIGKYLKMSTNDMYIA